MLGENKKPAPKKFSLRRVLIIQSRGTTQIASTEAYPFRIYQSLCINAAITEASNRYYILQIFGSEVMGI